MTLTAGSRAQFPVTFEMDPSASGMELLKRWMAAPNSGGFPERLGTWPVEVGEGFVRITCDIDEGHANFIAIVHGGVTAALVDMAGAAAVMTILAPGETLLTSDLTMRLLNAAPIDCKRLEASGKIAWRDNRKVVVEVSVATPSGLMIAHGTVGASIRRNVIAT